MQGAGSPLYALASVVDDIDHGVTHVIASHDLVATTAAQIPIYAALNAPPPVFVHPSTPHSKQGQTISRHLFSVRDLKARGIEPLTVASLLVTLGTPNGVVVRLALEELANRLILGELSGDAAAIEPGDFDALNPKVVRALPFKSVRRRLADMGLEEVTEPFWLAVRSDLDKLSDAEPWWRVVRGPCKPVIEDSAAATKSSGALPPGDWDETTWQSWKRMAGVAPNLAASPWIVSSASPSPALRKVPR
jgi:glutamyl-tRNA synthetase